MSVEQLFDQIQQQMTELHRILRMDQAENNQYPTNSTSQNANCTHVDKQDDATNDDEKAESTTSIVDTLLAIFNPTDVQLTDIELSSTTQDSTTPNNSVNPFASATATGGVNLATAIGRRYPLLNSMLSELPQHVKGCYDRNPLESVVAIRRMLSLERRPPIQQVIDSGVVPQIMQILKNNAGKYEIVCNGYVRELQLDLIIPEEIIRLCIVHCIDDVLQNECIWIITNISSGTAQHTSYVIKQGAIPVLIHSLWLSSSLQVQSGAIWALGNICGDSPQCRNLVLTQGILDRILPVIKRTNHINIKEELDVLRQASWTLSNITRGKPKPDTNYIQLILEGSAILLQYDDDEILSNVCWEFSYISQDDANTIISSGLAPKLISLLEHSSANVRHPCLRAIGNILAEATDEQTDIMINFGLLQKLKNNLLSETRVTIQREICWLISNITAGTESQVGQVIDSNIMQSMIQLLETASDNIAKEALWVISNATSSGTDEHVIFLVNQGVIPHLCQFISTTSYTKCRLVALECIDNILAVGEKIKNNEINEDNNENKYAILVENANGRNIMESILANDNVTEDIYDKCCSIIETYFDDGFIGIARPISHLNNESTTNEASTKPLPMINDAIVFPHLEEDITRMPYSSIPPNISPSPPNMIFPVSNINRHEISKKEDQRLILMNGFYRESINCITLMKLLIKHGVPIEILKLCDKYYYFEIVDHKEYDIIYNEIELKLEPVKAWRWDPQKDKWRTRGRGKLFVYYNKHNKNGDAKIIFWDEKHDKTRLLQYINKTNIAKAHKIQNGNFDSDGNEEWEVVKDCVEWEAEDFTMDRENGLFGRWKLKFMDNLDTATQYLECVNTHK